MGAWVCAWARGGEGAFCYWSFGRSCRQPRFRCFAGVERSDEPKILAEFDAFHSFYICYGNEINSILVRRAPPFFPSYLSRARIPTYAPSAPSARVVLFAAQEADKAELEGKLEAMPGAQQLMRTKERLDDSTRQYKSAEQNAKLTMDEMKLLREQAHECEEKAAKAQVGVVALQKKMMAGSLTLLEAALAKM